MTSFMDGPSALFHNRLPKTGGQNFRPALRIAELLLIGRHDGCHINCLMPDQKYAQLWDAHYVCLYTSVHVWSRV